VREQLSQLVPPMVTVASSAGGELFKMLCCHWGQWVMAAGKGPTFMKGADIFAWRAPALPDEPSIAFLPLTI
jgi:hypothetical protein